MLMMPVYYVGFAEGFAAAQPMLRIVHMSCCAIGRIYYFSQVHCERTVSSSVQYFSVLEWT